MSWKTFAYESPELAAFGRDRLLKSAAYLATIKADGAPRVHPVTPIIGDGLFVFMEPGSPKGHDLRRDSRYALHCGVEDNSGGDGEFVVHGRARLAEDAAIRAQAEASASYTPAARYILFELEVTSVQSTIYADSGPVRIVWKRTAE